MKEWILKDRMDVCIKDDVKGVIIDYNKDNIEEILTTENNIEILERIIKNFKIEKVKQEKIYKLFSIAVITIIIPFLLISGLTPDFLMSSIQYSTFTKLIVMFFISKLTIGQLKDLQKETDFYDVSNLELNHILKTENKKLIKLEKESKNIISNEKEMKILNNEQLKQDLINKLKLIHNYVDKKKFYQACYECDMMELVKKRFNYTDTELRFIESIIVADYSNKFQEKNKIKRITK